MENITTNQTLKANTGDCKGSVEAEKTKNVIDGSKENETVDKLVKNDENIAIRLIGTKKYDTAKDIIMDICKSMAEPTDRYDPRTSLSEIERYIDNQEKPDRILYSVISKYVFSLSDENQGVFNTNVEYLLHYVLTADNGSVSEDCRRIAIKLFDHYNLVRIQVDSIKAIFDSEMADTKDKVKNDIKGVEREYVTILGIFAAIILAFVGQITFSTSVLQYIQSASIYRLLFVIVMLTFALINIIWLLLKFIMVINEKDTEFYDIKKINIALGIIAILIVVAWYLHTHPVQIPVAVNQYNNAIDSTISTM